MIVFPHWDSRRVASLIPTIRPQTKSSQSNIFSTRFLITHVPSTADASALPTRGNGRLVAFPFRPRAHRTLGHQLPLHCSERFLDLQSFCIDSLRHLVSCETLMAELCLEIVDGVTRVHQQPLGLLARRGLLPKGLPGGVQLLKARAAVTMNDSDGNVAVARKLTPLMWSVGRGVRMRQVGCWRRFPVEAERTSHLQLSCA